MFENDLCDTSFESSRDRLAGLGVLSFLDEGKLGIDGVSIRLVILSIEVGNCR
jgi:hypothetical protein